MDSGHDKKRMNIENDRLSSLPDDIIHKILSFITTKQAIETSALSSRWRFLWTSMPFLNFSSEDFPSSLKSSQFVTDVFSRRNNRTKVSSLKFTCNYFHWVHVKKIINYALLYKVQQLTLTSYNTDTFNFPVCVITSRSLKHLTLDSAYYSKFSVPASATWELLALTTLILRDVAFYDHSKDKKCIDLFAKCVNLKNLTLDQCIMESEGFRIGHPRLSNLTIRDTKGKLFRRYDSLQFSTDCLHSLEKLDLCIDYPYKAEACKIFGLLQQLNDVKFLTLNTELVEFISSYLERDFFSYPSSPFTNLKSLKIYPTNIYPEGEETMPNDVTDYFLDSSPSAVFTFISREESRVVWNTTQAQNHMAFLRVMLEKENVSIENENETKKTQVENEDSRESSRDIDSCWRDLIVQIKQGKEKTNDIISKLKNIERFLIKLPEIKRAKIQPSFSSLRAEANTVINKIMNCVKIQCDEKQSLLNGYLHELATGSHQTS